MANLFELTTISDLEKNVVVFPIIPLIDTENNKITFSFVDFQKMKEHITSVLSKCSTENLNQSNVFAYEKEIAIIKKLADLVKKSAKEYIEEFSLTLVGRHRGNNRVRGQVDELYELFMNKYNELHKETKAIRESMKTADLSNETEETINNTTQVVLTLNKAFMSDLKAFCKKRNIEIGEIK